ncbi:MAG: PGF-CTERM sorting domain-containing protein [Methanoregulaceae archaeon]|nr:PGF-CTERM sorting domain-containing protein [Methanoregulaceae archaeon]
MALIGLGAVAFLVVRKH